LTGRVEIESRPWAPLEILLAELGIVFFIADLTAGVVMPTFSLYATSLGASLAMIGVLAACSAGVPLILSVPLGALSDRRGRRSILVGGVVVTGVACALFTLVTSPWQLVGPNVLFGVGILAALSIGPAYIGDVLESGDRRRGVAVYTIAMGAGYAVGSALAGYSVAHVGYVFTYRTAGVLCIASGAIAYVRFGRHRYAAATASDATKEPSAALPDTDRRSGMASLGNAAFNMSWVAAISVFLPVYALELGVPVQAIGLLFMIRGLVSTAARVPLGSVVSRIPFGPTLLAPMAVEAVAVVLIAVVHNALGLALVLAVDGIAYAAFLTASQTFLIGHRTNRGMAQGAYWTAGALGASFGAATLGIAAQLFGVRSVFLLASAGIVAIFVVTLGLSRAPRSGTIPR